MRLFTVKTLNQYIRVLAEINPGERELWYRGQSCAKYRLTPSALRQVFALEDQMGNPINTLDNVCSGSNNIVTWIPVEKMIEEFKEKAKEYIEYKATTDIEWECIGQHYGIPTKVLDWTTNALIALYFAVSDCEIGTDIEEKIFSESGRQLVRSDEQRTVDIKDVTGSGFIYLRCVEILFALTVAIVTLVCGVVGSGFRVKTLVQDMSSSKASVEYLKGAIKCFENLDVTRAEYQRLQYECSILYDLYDGKEPEDDSFSKLKGNDKKIKEEIKSRERRIEELVTTIRFFRYTTKPSAVCLTM